MQDRTGKYVDLDDLSDVMNLSVTYRPDPSHRPAVAYAASLNPLLTLHSG